MPQGDAATTGQITIAADLGAAEAPEAHAALIARLESGGSLEVELEGDGADIAPLALQLLASAERSFAADRIAFGERAAAALASLKGRRNS